MANNNPLWLRINGKDRIVPRFLWNALQGPKPKHTNFLDSDGCSFSPDVLGRFLQWLGRPAIKLFPACWVHDAQYRRVPGADLGGTWADRRAADWFLARNLFALCRLQGLGVSSATMVATLYWTAVRLHGQGAYHFDEGMAPLGRWQRYREVALLFLRKPEFE